MSLDMVLDTVAGVCLIAGALLCLAAGIALVRFPDVLSRMHAAAKPQVLGLLPAQGGFVEAVFPETGRFPVVSHLMVDAERGAHGFIEVTG